MTTTSMFRLLLTLVAAGSLALAGCGSGDGTTEPATPTPDDGTVVDTGPDPETLAADDVVLIWTETGGCAMAGPNCARYEVQADGTVTTYREGEPDPAASGSVAPEVVATWVAMVRDTDTSELVGRLGPGEMTAAFDGIDFFLEVPFTGFAVSSVDKEFDEGEPFFAAVADVVRAAAEAAPLEIEFR